MVKASDIVEAARELIGVRYVWWAEGDPLPMYYYDYPDSAPPVWYMRQNGTMCSDLINWARMYCGLPAIGGTPAYYDWLYAGGEWFDPSVDGVAGALCVNPGIWRGGAGQGHVALYSGAHTLIQATDGVGSFAGVNEGEQDYDSHGWANYWLYGLMPDVDYSEYIDDAPDPVPALSGPPRWVSIDRDGWYRADGPDWSKGWHTVTDGRVGDWKGPNEA